MRVSLSALRALTNKWFALGSKHYLSLTIRSSGGSHHDILKFATIML